jgi:hypothetical protein
MIVIVVCVIIVTMIVMIIMRMVVMAVIIVMCVIVIMVIIMRVVMIVIIVAVVIMGVIVMIMVVIVVVRMFIVIIMVVVIIVAVFTNFNDINTGAGCDDRGLCVAGFDQPLKKALKAKTIGDHKVCAGNGNYVCGDRLIDVSVLTRTDYAGDRNMITAYRAGHIRKD